MQRWRFGLLPGLVLAFRLHGTREDAASLKQKITAFPDERLLKGLGFAPLLLRPSPLHGYSLLFGDVLHHQDPALSLQLTFV